MSLKLELTFRLAKPSDFHEILQLSEGMNNEHDYLPVRYHTWMKMDKLEVMLAYHEDKLVGLVACSLVDDERILQVIFIHVFIDLICVF